MAVTLEQRPSISEGDVDVVSIDCTNYLDADELLTGTPTVAEVDTDDLSFSNIGVSQSELTILRKSVEIGHAVQFKVAGQQSGVTYRVRVTFYTDSSPQRTKVVDVLLTCA